LTNRFDLSAAFATIIDGENRCETSFRLVESLTTGETPVIPESWHVMFKFFGEGTVPPGS